MHLKKIKIAGFKSFADVTTIELPGYLTGIVGPNGCGKSNVVDALRWAIGVSGVRHMRGATDDVIFNGSAARKRVGLVSVELYFDNTDHAFGGRYDSYSEISVRREANRQGTSTYSLNGTRCRRRDIVDLFLGTGLGGHSYAVVEQGTVSRLVDAKPEELYSYIEEAAGVSKYRERRRETENRIARTRDNLSRVEDLYEEVNQQIARLKRQAKLAENFKALKEQQGEYRAQGLYLQRTEQLRLLQTQETTHEQSQQALDTHLTEKRALNEQVQSRRETLQSSERFHQEKQDALHQRESDIALCEQRMRHATENSRRDAQELDAMVQSHTDMEALLAQDTTRLQVIEQTIGTCSESCQSLEHNRVQALSHTEQTEQALHTKQQALDDITQQHLDLMRQSESEQARVEYLQQSLEAAQVRHESLRKAQADVPDEAEFERQLSEAATAHEHALSEEEKMRAQLEQGTELLAQNREQQRRDANTLDRLRTELQAARGRMGSLEALQREAIGDEDHQMQDWLERQQMHQLQRLVHLLEIDSGWELAVEVVLGRYLEGLTADHLPENVEKLDQGRLVLLERSAAPQAASGNYLYQHVRNSDHLPQEFYAVRIAKSLPEALQLRAQLGAGESLVTQDGYWVGRNWLQIYHAKAVEDSVLLREGLLKSLRLSIKKISADINELDERYLKLEEEIKRLEAQRSQHQEQLNQAHRLVIQCEFHREKLESNQAQVQRNRAILQADISNLAQESAKHTEELQTIEARYKITAEQIATLEARREEIGAERDTLTQALRQSRERTRACDEDYHRAEVSLRSGESERQSLQQQIQRTTLQLTSLAHRKAQLASTINERGSPVHDLELEREALVDQRQIDHQQREASKADLIEAERAVNQVLEQLASYDQAESAHRQRLEQASMACLAARTKIQMLDEQLQENNIEVATYAPTLPDAATADAWAEKLQRITERIERMGAINLTAIDDLSELQQRHGQIDEQRTDIIEALNALETSMQSIDQTTRTRLEETFTKINQHLQGNYAKLFAGGEAYLSQLNNDGGTPGVVVMTKPLGKQITNMKLLSGGEKALTSLALIMSFFELNPAPFCVLDEVDAPLDEANVERFNQLITTMSETVQFILVTHQRGTIHAMDHLLGVTMQEPGVSRVVSVDMAEAASHIEA